MLEKKLTLNLLMMIQDLKIILSIMFVTQKELHTVCYLFVHNNSEKQKFYFQIVRKIIILK